MSKTGSGRTMSTRDGGFGRLDGYLLNAVPDQQDLRDYLYEPALIRLRNEVLPPKERTVLDQGDEGACTGFGLAAVINRLLAERGEARTVSARMLYEMAKKLDRWLGDRYEGSSCRAAVRGWQNMGVCSEKLAPYGAGERDWQMSIERAKDARKTTLGAYHAAPGARARLSLQDRDLNGRGRQLQDGEHDPWRLRQRPLHDERHPAHDSRRVSGPTVHRGRSQLLIA